MLSIERVAFGREGYYLGVTAAGGHTEGLVERDGVWLGAGAAALGLSGPVTARDLRLVLAGVHPVTGEAFLRQPDRRSLAAFDCTFSTPKSVSVLHALASDAVVSETLAGHESAVCAALGYLEAEAMAVAVWGVDGRRVIRGGGMVAVGFVHRMNRAPEPHLHTHVLIANLVVDLEGERPARPLDARGLFVERRTADALYETHLRRELTDRLRVEWGYQRGWWADLKGITEEQRIIFSSRSVIVREVEAVTGLQGPAARRMIAAATRPPKDLTVPYGDTRESWRETGFRAGLSNSRLAAVCGRAPVTLEPGPGWEEAVLRVASIQVADGSLSRRDLVVARCATAIEGLDVASVLRDVDTLIESELIVARGEAVPALRGGVSSVGRVTLGRSESRYTTSAILATEARLIDTASEMESRLTVVAYAPGKRLGALEELSRAAATWTSEDRQVIALAPSKYSAASFEAATGIETIARHPRAAASPDSRETEIPSLGPGSVVVLTEAPSYGPAMLEELVGSCGASGAELVLAGARYGMDRRHDLGPIVPLAEGRLPGGPEDLSSVSLPLEWRRFGAVTTVAAPSLSAALDSVLELSSSAGSTQQAVGSGAGRPIIVCADTSIEAALRERCRSLPVGAGLGPGAEPLVVHSRALPSLLQADGTEASGKRHIVVIGGAGVLRRVPAASTVDRTHVVVTPELASIERTAGPGRAGLQREVLGRLAEAARPQYLVSVIGRPPRDGDARRDWRQGACAIEEFRDKWEVTDPRKAFGKEPSRTGVDLDRATDRARIERDLRARGLERGRNKKLELGR